MFKLNYIIATYAAITKRKYMFAENTLKTHLQQLLTLNHDIDCITIMKADTGNKDIYKKYYDVDDIIEKIKYKFKCKIIFQDIENFGHSNGQWLGAINTIRENKTDNYDYYILVEDDYCPNIDNFDSVFIDCHKKLSINNIAMMSCYIQGKPLQKNHPFQLHYEGPVILSKETIEKLYLHWNNKPRKYLFHGHGGYSQISFSTLFTKSNIPHLDILSTQYKFIYWDDKQKFYILDKPNLTTHGLNRIKPIHKIDFQNYKYLNNCLFVPIQAVRKCILILSMHRSGSSMLGGCLDICGIDFGINKSTVKNSYNSKGYFENMTILRFNEKVLKAIKSGWNDTKIITQKQINIMLTFTSELITIISREFKQNIFFIKDPRIILLFPLYYNALKSLDIIPNIIRIDRDYDNISKSLFRAQRVPVNIGKILCNKYIGSLDNILEKYKNINLIKTNIDDILHNIYPIIHKLEKIIGTVVLNKQNKQNLTKFIDKKLINFNSTLIKP